MKKTFKAFLVALLCFLTMSATMSSASAAAGPTVKVKSVATSSVTIYWTKVSLATSYDIQRSTDAKNWTTIKSGVKTTEYTDSASLTTGKSYAYRVRAKFAIGTSDWSSYVVGKPLPAKVTGLKVSAANATAVQLTWTKVAGVSGYTVQYYSGGKWKNYKNVTTNSLVVSGLKLGTNYYFRVAAYKTVSGKAVYGTVSDYIKTTPVIPATSKVVLSALNATALKLQWAGVSGAKGFEVYNYSTGKWVNAGAKTNIIISNLQPGESYDFAVRAYAGSVKGKATGKYTFKTAPAAAQGVAIKEVTDNSVTFTWEAVKGAAGYQPAYRLANGTWKTLSLTSGTTATVTGLTSLTEYGFRVRAYVTNSNVYNIGANAAGAWSGEVKTKTVLAPAKAAAGKSTSATDTSFTWTAVSGAVGYTVEKYDTNNKWKVYDFKTKSWKNRENLSETSVITTTDLSFLESGLATRSEVYRVRAVDANGNEGTPSNNVTCYTSDIAMNNTSSTFVVQQTLRWPASEGAVSYEVFKRNPLTSTEAVTTFEAANVTRTDGTCQANLYLAPNSIHSIMILAYNAEGTITTATNWITFAIGDVLIVAKNHNYYDSAVNSQLNYLAQAINNTKAYKDTLTVTNKSEVAYQIDSLKIPILGVNKKTAEEVEEFFKSYDDAGDMPTSAVESVDTTVIFKDGSGVYEDGRTVRLKNFIEPSSNDTGYAYLYNSQNYKAWKNGFESVTTTKNSDGSITMNVVFKQESMDTNYHNGFISTFSAADFGAGSGLEVKKLLVGKSTITATIDKNGILTSFVANSPYEANFAASFTAESNSGGGVIDSLVTMEMGISGRTEFNLKFVK